MFSVDVYTEPFQILFQYVQQDVFHFRKIHRSLACIFTPSLELICILDSVCYEAPE